MDLLGKFFGREVDAENRPGKTGGGVAGHDTRIATCALFLEMAGADGQFSDDERERIVSILKERFALSDEDAAGLTREAQRRLDGSLDIWEFTNRINENYSIPEKLDILRLVWRVVFADGALDAHEEYVVRKVAKLLRLSHKQMIDAKLEARREMEGEGGG